MPTESWYLGVQYPLHPWNILLLLLANINASSRDNRLWFVFNKPLLTGFGNSTTTQGACPVWHSLYSS